MLFRTLAAFACAIALTATAQASTTYDFSIDNPGGATNAGNIDAFSASYNTDGFLSFSTSLSTNGNGRLADGGWIVMSPGDNPKGTTDELAVFYMDFAGGDVYAYSYNGVNGDDSWTNGGVHIQTFENALSVNNTVGGVTIGVDNIDVSSIQAFSANPDWTGASFADMIGIWAHFTVLNGFSAENGMITMWDSGWQSYYDTIEGQITQVPEPAGLALFGLLAIAGVLIIRRRRQLVPIAV